MKPLSARARTEAIGIRRDYRDQMRSRWWFTEANEWRVVEQDVHISSDPIAPGVPAVGWNKIDRDTHRSEAMIERFAAMKAGQ